MEDQYVIGIDTGGTFTDITVMGINGEVYIDKSPTTPRDRSVGVFDALAKVSEHMGLSPRELLRQCMLFKHGTTVATNALITREGSRVGIITTRGFEDTTLIMRAIGRVAGLSEDELKHQSTCVKPEPIVPKRLIRGVSERIDFRGAVVIPMDIEEARESVRSLVEDEKVEAIAVNFLFGFVNPVHERRMQALVREMYGDALDVSFTFASDLVPVVREYARSNTVVLNAFLDKTVRRYIKALGSRLREAGYKHPLLLMQSNGGIVHEEELTAIGTLQSGPCGGMIASKQFADTLGHSEVITTDMGGTSFDVGVMTDGYWRYMRDPVVERFHITWPMIEIESIGAGGGTIAWIDPITSRLRVGPNSAQAAPGPVCYDAGGVNPTVTDADLILGLIDPDYFLGGRMKLNKDKAAAAIKDKIAAPLGMDLIEAAAGIYEVINGHMSDLIRKRVVTTGHIPEEFVIYAFGGAGPVHAAAYGADLGVHKIYVFPTSAVFSSFGVAMADIIHTYTASYRYLMPVEPDVLNGKLGEIEKRLYEVMEREGVAAKDVQFRRRFHMRYRRQLNELAVSVPSKRYTADDVGDIVVRFEKRYEEVYGAGSAYSQAGIEIISFSVDAIASTPKPRLKAHPLAASSPDGAALKGYRDVFFGLGKQAVRTRICDYHRLRPGNELEGPAIVETPITTIVIPSGALAKVDGYFNMEITWREN